MTRDEYESKLTELERQLAELKAMEIEEDLPTPPHPRWKPDLTQMYTTINAQSYRYQSMWNGASWDDDAYSIGNVFKTKEAAEFAVERLKVLAEMREWAGRWNDEYVIRYHGEVDHITSGNTFACVSYGEMRFATEEDAENCIKAVGADRIKKYYFMITEE